MSHPSETRSRQSPDPRPESSAPLRGGTAEVVKLALPVVLTHLSITAMQIVDSIMVGQLGSPQLASVGFGGVWLWTLTCFFVGTTTCVQTFVSQHYGAGNNRACGSWAWQAIYVLGPMTLLLSTALYFGAGLLVGFLDPDPLIAPYAIDYMQPRALGCPGLIAAVALSSFFRGVGDTRTPLYASIVANLLNAVLDYGLIFGKLGLPELGIAGAGIATSVAEWTNFFALFYFFRRAAVARSFATQMVAPSKSDIRRLMRMGLPVGGQWWLEMSSYALFLTLVARMGDAPMAASQVFVSLLSISFMQAYGLGIAVSTLVGRYIGAKDLAAAERSFYSGVWLCLAMTGVVGLLLVFAAEPLLRLYTDDPRVLELGRPLMLVGAIYQVFDALSIIADGGLRGAGDTRWPLVLRFLISWLMFLPAAYILGIYLDGGLTWAWIGGLVSTAVLTAVLMGRFRGGRWKLIEI